MCNHDFTCPTDRFLCNYLGKFVCVPTERKCNGDIDCDNGMDEKNCTRPETCSEDEFRCMDRAQCIPAALRCDGKIDCRDGSDEAAVVCPNEMLCPPGQFACKSALQGSVTCLPRASVCDGHLDCSNGSDEFACANRICEPGEFRCYSGQCILQNSICDDKPDCRDESDEYTMLCLYKLFCPLAHMPCKSHNGSQICVDEARKCDGDVDCKSGVDERQDCAALAFRCRGTFFQCANGRCVPNSWKCDGENDCFDGSDEKNCAGDVDGHTENCSVAEFACSSSSACVPLSSRCDQRPDCPDESDERDCPTEISNFV
ncbi:hypothetical protein HPB50_029091 [Hyalomma asiaticum]|nr:hypothetical protein HPB50_029091 [Hyalomma asiaticum]